MKRSVFQLIIIVLSSILFGFLLTLLPNYFPVFELDITERVVSIIVLILFILFFLMTITMYIHSHFLIRKSQFISTLIPLRTFDSLREDGMVTFYNNMKKLIKKTKKSIIYITYPIDKYNVSNRPYSLYSKEYYSTKAGKEFKGFHKEMLNFIKNMFNTKNRMYFMMLIQNVTKKPKGIDDIENPEITIDNTSEKFFSKIEEYKHRIRSKTKHDSSIEMYNIVSNDEVIAIIADNTYMLLISRIMDKYVSSFVKDPAVVKEFVAHASMKIPESF